MSCRGAKSEGRSAKGPSVEGDKILESMGQFVEKAKQGHRERTVKFEKFGKDTRDGAKARAEEMTKNLAEKKEIFVKEAGTINAELKNALKAFVGGSDEVTEYAIDNEYIVRGYRINHNTNGRSIKSIFVCHNETVNIWSHGLGVVFFLIILIATLIWIVPRQLAFGEELI